MNAPGQPRVHPTAIVEPGAVIAPDVEIGAYTLVGAHVQIGAGTRIGPHCVITGHTRLGANNQIAQFSSIGEAPQDKKYAGEPTRLEVGDNNTIREFCTLNRGTTQDAGVTRIGNDNWIMAYVHVAHDCQVGNRTIFANNAQLAGHVRIEDDVILGGFTLVHQFCRVGMHSITGLGTVLLQDVPPYVKASGNPVHPYGLNSEGLRRRGFSADALSALKRAYRTLYRAGLTLEEARDALAEQAADSADVRALLEFVSAPGRGIVR